MKYINAIILRSGAVENLQVQIDCTETLHELEIYLLLEEMFPAYINVNADDELQQCGYSFSFSNGALAVAIYRSL